MAYGRWSVIGPDNLVEKKQRSADKDAALDQIQRLETTPSLLYVGPLDSKKRFEVER